MGLGFVPSAAAADAAAGTMLRMEKISAAWRGMGVGVGVGVGAGSGEATAAGDEAAVEGIGGQNIWAEKETGEEESGEEAAFEATEPAF